MPRAAGASPARLRPEMSSRRLQVLRFVRDYIGQWHGSPSLGEIERGLGIARHTVKDAIESLVHDGLLLRAPGPRGLRLPTERDQALRVLRELGWQVVERGADGPHSSLQPAIDLDYDPEA